MNQVIVSGGSIMLINLLWQQHASQLLEKDCSNVQNVSPLRKMNFNLFSE